MRVADEGDVTMVEADNDVAAGEAEPADSTSTAMADRPGNGPHAGDAAAADAAAEEVTAEEVTAGDGAPPESSDSTAVAAAEPAKHRRMLYVTLPGCWGAVIASCLAFTPSLLPRTGVIQGLLWGIAAAIGYGVATIFAWIWRAFADREARTASRRSWLILAIAGGVILVVMWALGQYWQSLLRDMMNVTEYNIGWVIASPLIALFMFGLLMAISRGIRGVYRWITKLLDRYVGPKAAKATGWILAAAMTYLVISGVLLDGLVSAANEAFSLRNNTTDAGVVQPTTTLRSGGPGSLIPWDTLGQQGRKFVHRGPRAADIQALTGQPAMDPIRIYSGVESAGSSSARAQLAADDLERAGGFDREYLLVFTTTGSGWVDPASVDSFEYLAGGDAATVTMQYSYLPSWMSYLVDQTKARAAGRDLFDAVYAKWSKLPADHRPKLYVGGESLGSFGGEAAFSGVHDLTNRTDGVVFAGPPNFNTLFRDFVDNRDSGSTEITPVYQNGETVRFSNDPTAGIPPADQPWSGTRVLYMMNGSDPIVWWSPNLLFSKPDWLSDPPTSDMLGGSFWMPLVTFWQVTADLPFATGVPGGHGHTYRGGYVDAWAAVMQPPGFTAAQIDALRLIIEPNPGS